MRFTACYLSAAFLAFAVITPSAPAAPAPDEVTIDFNRYAAAAYSPKTGKYGYSWNWGSRAAAEREALSECKADDAKIVGWVKGGWLVLAVADDNAYGVGYEYGDGAGTAEAKKSAIEDCLKHTKSKNPPKVKFVLCSGNYKPKVYE